METKVFLRKADKEDMELIFAWANEKLCRANSISEKNISIEEHKRWFHEKLQDKNCRFYIMELNDKPAGQARIDIEENMGTISYSLDKRYRGQGYGRIIISLLENKVVEENLCSGLLAVVKSGNIASQHIFESKGYRQIQSEDGIIIYCKDRLKMSGINEIIPGRADKPCTYHTEHRP